MSILSILVDSIFFTDLKYIILWDDAIVDGATEAPLYLIELEKENELLELLFKKYDKGIATYFQSPYALETLQKYYSTFTYPQVEIEKDNFQKGIFGFYDPRILPNYLETLYTQDKVDEFFAGTALWLTPRVEDESLAHFAFRTKRGSFDSVSLTLENFINEENISLDFNNIFLPTIEDLAVYSQERTIDYTQIKFFDEMEKVIFIDKLFIQYKKNNYKVDNQINREKVNKLFNEAKSLDIETEAGIYKYILLSFLLDKPLATFSFYQKLLKDIDEETKIEIMDDYLSNKIKRGKII